MTQWPATKARRVLAALLRIGWQIKRETGSHRTLRRDGWPDAVFAFHDADELGPLLAARDKEAPYSTTWNTGLVAAGSYALWAVAYDSSAHSTKSNEVTITTGPSPLRARART